MITDNVKAKGHVSFVLLDSESNVKQSFDIPNLVVSIGKELIASRLFANTDAVISHMAVGANNTSPTLTETTLREELARVALDGINTAISGNQITYVASFGAGVGTGSIKEAGLFNAGTAGTMLCRTAFTAFDKGASDTLIVNWNITIL